MCFNVLQRLNNGIAYNIDFIYIYGTPVCIFLHTKRLTSFAFVRQMFGSSQSIQFWIAILLAFRLIWKLILPFATHEHESILLQTSNGKFDRKAHITHLQCDKMQSRLWLQRMDPLQLLKIGSESDSNTRVYVCAVQRFSRFLGPMNFKPFSLSVFLYVGTLRFSWAFNA